MGTGGRVSGKASGGGCASVFAGGVAGSGLGSVGEGLAETLAGEEGVGGSRKESWRERGGLAGGRDGCGGGGRDGSAAGWSRRVRVSSLRWFSLSGPPMLILRRLLHAWAVLLGRRARSTAEQPGVSSREGGDSSASAGRMSSLSQLRSGGSASYSSSSFAASSSVFAFASSFCVVSPILGPT